MELQVLFPLRKKTGCLPDNGVVTKLSTFKVVGLPAMYTIVTVPVAHKGSTDGEVERTPGVLLIFSNNAGKTKMCFSKSFNLKGKNKHS